MTGFSGIVLPRFLSEELIFLNQWGITFGGTLRNLQASNYSQNWIIGCFLIVILSKNSMQLKDTFIPSYMMAFCLSVFTLLAILNISGYSEFLYFNF